VPGAPINWVSRPYPITPERASLASLIGISAEHVGIDVARNCPADERTKANGFLV